MTLILDPQQMQTTRSKNLATSYGLTLVVGLPFPRPILAQVARLWERVDAAWPGCVRWVAPSHLHATVMAPLRGRYRAEPPLQHHELPVDLAGFVEELNRCFTALEPFPLNLDRLCLAPDGRLLALGADPGNVRSRVTERLAPFAGLDRPKALAGWHVALGYLQSPETLAAGGEHVHWEADWACLQATSLGVLEVVQVWLVHYADRMLSRIVGKTPLRLGRPNALTEASFLTALGIRQSSP